MDKDFPIIGEIKWVNGWYLKMWTKDGFEFTSGNKSSIDLVEVSPYADWPIDSKVLCWDNTFDKKHKEYFAGVCEATGNPLSWSAGKTSWSADKNLSKIIWLNMELVE